MSVENSTKEGLVANLFEPDELLSIDKLSDKYKSVFSSYFSKFNAVQTTLFDLIVNDEKTLVICSPTASGKTVLLELAIIHQLMKLESRGESFSKFHCLYLAPLKAIVQEKCLEWSKKFSAFQLKCFALTGDTEPEDYDVFFREHKFSEINILLATPEKFDYMIRTNVISRQLLLLLQLVLIDEIHMLGDRQRGDILEATVTRIKALRQKENCSESNGDESNKNDSNDNENLRFVAVSATAPNVGEIAAWLDLKNNLGVFVPSQYRPVELSIKVFDLEPIRNAITSEYRYDIQLSYKLEHYIREYASKKPTLIFCSTRRSVEFTAKVLASSQQSYFESIEQKTRLFYELTKLISNEIKSSAIQQLSFKNPELKLALSSGVAFYHSGLDFFDRRLLERLFVASLIPVLVSTSSLAMGVNLPAHLVIIKNTVQYAVGSNTEYDITQILQMIGRAGRPQYDTKATAIIITKPEKRKHYEELLSTQKNVESNLFRTLLEQLMVEIVLRTVVSIDSAVEWICSTFLFIRIVRNPSFYKSNIKPNDFESAFPIIENWCRQNLKRLISIGIIYCHHLEDNSSLEPSQLARIATRYAISVETAEKLIEWIKSKLEMDQLLDLLCQCRELSQETVLRVNEKQFLNAMNKRIRFKYRERIKTSSMKINCLLQASLESLPIESCLLQDCTKLIRSIQRITKCLFEFFLYLFNLNKKELSKIFSQKNSKEEEMEKFSMHFTTAFSIAKLVQSIRAKLWYDSDYVVKQLPKIGPALSKILVENGYTSFEKFRHSSPRLIEFHLKRNPPFGSYLLAEIKSLPKYCLQLEQIINSKIEDKCLPMDDQIKKLILSKKQINVKLIKYLEISEKNCFLQQDKHYVVLMVGCQQCDEIIFMQRINDRKLNEQSRDSHHFNHSIIIVWTKIESTKFEFLNKNQLAATAKTTSSKKTTTNKKKTAEAVVEEISHKPSKELLKFVEDLESKMHSNKKQNEKLHYYHCSSIDQKTHTIKAMVVSESFVGIDVEIEMIVDDSPKDTNLVLVSKNFSESTLNISPLTTRIDLVSDDQCFSNNQKKQDDNIVLLKEVNSAETLDFFDNENDQEEADLLMLDEADEMFALKANLDYSENNENTLVFEEESSNLKSNSLEEEIQTMDIDENVEKIETNQIELNSSIKPNEQHQPWKNEIIQQACSVEQIQLSSINWANYKSKSRNDFPSLSSRTKLKKKIENVSHKKLKSQNWENFANQSILSKTSAPNKFKTNLGEKIEKYRQNLKQKPLSLLNLNNQNNSANSAIFQQNDNFSLNSSQEPSTESIPNSNIREWIQSAKAASNSSRKISKYFS